MGLSEQIAEDKLRHLPHKACSFGHPCTTRGFGGRDHEDAVHMARHMPGADPARSLGRGSPAPRVCGGTQPPCPRHARPLLPEACHVAHQAQQCHPKFTSTGPCEWDPIWKKGVCRCD